MYRKLSMVLKLLQEMQIDGISEVFRRNHIDADDLSSDDIVNESIDMNQEIDNFRSPKKPQFSNDSKEVVIDLRREMGRGREDKGRCGISTPLKYSQSTPSLHGFSYRKNRLKTPETFLISPTQEPKLTMATPKAEKFFIQKELSPQHFLKPHLGSTAKINFMRTYNLHGRCSR